MNPRIQIMLASRHLEEQPPAPGEVEGMWIKALDTWRSSAVPGLSPDARFTLIYQAALQASTAVLRAAGYQTRGEAHHHHTFAGVAALSVPGLPDSARDLNLIRQRRHGAVYDWRSRMEEEDVEEIHTPARQIFAQAEAWLEMQYPNIDPFAPGPA